MKTMRDGMTFNFRKACIFLLASLLITSIPSFVTLPRYGPLVVVVGGFFAAHAIADYLDFYFHRRFLLSTSYLLEFLLNRAFEEPRNPVLVQELEQLVNLNHQDRPPGNATDDYINLRCRVLAQNFKTHPEYKPHWEFTA